MKKLVGLLGIAVLTVIALSACQTLFGRGHGPIESFAFLPQYNPGLSRAVQGQIVESANPKVIEVVVPPGTDLSHLVATLSFNTEATITVISSGQNVAQVNSKTANNFESPVLYSIKTQKDKQPWTYRVMVRHADQNPLLSQIRVVDGSPLQPNFSPNTMIYSSTVPYASNQVTIEATAQSPHLEKMTIGGHEVPGARASVVVPFSGVNSLSVPITTVAEDQTTTSHYTVNILRGQPDHNSALAALSINNAAVNPAFSPAQMSYSLEVPYATTSITVKAAPQSQFASVTLEESTSQGGLAPLPSQGNPQSESGAQIDLNQANVMDLVVVVTAQDGTTSDYTVAITRAAPDHNSLLGELQVPGATVSPQFDPNQLQYNVDVPYTASQFSVVALPQSTLSSVSLVGGQTTGNPDSPDGAAVQFAGLSGESLSIQVTAQDGSVRTYTLNVQRSQPDSNSRLAMLLVTPGTLSPSFSPDTVSYNAVIPGNASSANITVQTESLYATVSTSESGITQSGSAANGQVFTVPVEPARTRAVDLLVTAQNGSQRIYHVSVTREAAPIQPAPKEHNSRLSGIVVGGANLVPAFSPGRLEYTVNVPTSRNRVSIFPISESPKASVSVDGKPLGRSAETIELKPGTPRIVVIQVVAEDGSSSRYTVTMTRVLPKPLREQGQGQGPEQGQGPGAHPSQPAPQPGNANVRPSTPEPQQPSPQPGSEQQRPQSQSGRPAPEQPGSAQQGAAPQEIQTTLTVRSDRGRIDPHVWQDIRNANDQLGTQATVTVRSQATQQVLFQGTAPVEVRQPGNSPPEITLSWQSPSFGIPSNQQISINVAIQTARGWYVHSTEVVSPQGRITVSMSSWSYSSGG